MISAIGGRRWRRREITRCGTKMGKGRGRKRRRRRRSTRGRHITLAIHSHIDQADIQVSDCNVAEARVREAASSGAHGCTRNARGGQS